MVGRRSTISWDLLFDVRRLAEHIGVSLKPSGNGGNVKSPRVFFEDYLPETLGGFGMALPAGTVVVFHVEGPGGGDWQIARTKEGAVVSEVDQAPKDCEMWCSAETFMRIVAGGLGSSRAFLGGQLRISGDVGLALKCERLLHQAA
jgi:hypothetical protein